MLISLLLAICFLVWLCQIMVALINIFLGDVTTKEEFLTSLIPILPIYINLKNKYKELK